MNRIRRSLWSLLIPLVLYFGGIILCPSEDIYHLQNQVYADQKEYTWIDGDGDEHEGQTLIKIEGIGIVLTYRDIYFSALFLFIPFLIIGRMLYGENQDELKSIIFGNCVIGLMLISLSTKSHTASTIMYWAGIFTLNYIGSHTKQEQYETNKQFH